MADGFGGLLDFLKTPQGQGLLATGLGAAASYGHGRGLLGNVGAGGLMGLNAYNGAQSSEQERKLRDIQMQAGQVQLDETRRKLTDADTARAVLADFYKNQGMPQSAPAATGQLGSGSFGAVVPAGGQPAIPAQAGVTPKAAVWQQYKALGDQLASRGLVDQAQQYYGLAEKMRPKYGTEPRVMSGPDGKLMNVLVGEDGSTQVLPFGVKPAIKMQDLGGKVVALDENALQNGQAFGKTMTPGEVASNQLGWANNSATLRGQNLTDARAREQIALGKVPAGYRQTANGSLEFIPGGPADPNAAKKAAPTEFQGKAAMFGSRAQEADRIISELEGKYSPSAINTKQSLGGAPLIGGALEAGGNMMLSAPNQKAEQAQRDFVNAVLRLESGAAISQGEFENARKQYFPQPGDSKPVIAQKAANRKLAIQGLINNARPGAVESTGGASGSFATAPDIDSLLKKYGGK